jgi:phytol kinase
MINAIVATGFVFVLLVLSELLWKGSRIRGEFSRKFVHVIAGSFAAFLPFWVDYGWIALLALGAVIAGLVNRRLKIFSVGSGVRRKSYGDLLFGIAILISALLKPNKWLFAGAILQVALADGFAAIIGTRNGKHKYVAFSHSKSPIGTLAFYVVSLLVTLLALHFGGEAVAVHKLEVIAIVPLVLTVIENVSGYGTDNLTLPLGFLALMYVL